jgi:hypothetical protein
MNVQKIHKQVETKTISVLVCAGVTWMKYEPIMGNNTCAKMMHE